MCTSVLPLYMYVNYIHAWCPWRPEEGVDTLELELRMVMSHYVGTVD